MPLNPYQRGQLWWWLADETRPREPQIECILGNEEDQSRTLERMRVWLNTFGYVQLPPVLSAKFSHVRLPLALATSREEGSKEAD